MAQVDRQQKIFLHQFHTQARCFTLQKKVILTQINKSEQHPNIPRHVFHLSF